MQNHSKQKTPALKQTEGKFNENKMEDREKLLDPKGKERIHKQIKNTGK